MVFGSLAESMDTMGALQIGASWGMLVEKRSGGACRAAAVVLCDVDSDKEVRSQAAVAAPMAKLRVQSRDSRELSRGVG